MKKEPNKPPPDEWKCDTCKKTFAKKQMVWREDKKGNKTNRWCVKDYFKQ
jgi:hypothetical protein